MSKKFLLSVVAVSVIASVASAGEINPTVTVNGTSTVVGSSDDVNVSSQWIQQNSLLNKASDVNVSAKAVYEPTKIPLGSMKNPVLNITYSNVKDIKTPNLSNTFVCEVNTNGLPIANKPAVLKYKANNGVNGFSYVAETADTYMTNGHFYRIFTDVNESNCSEASTGGTEINATNVDTYLVSNAATLSLDKNDNVNVTYTLGTGDSQEVQDTATTPDVVKVGNQFTANVTTPFSNKIDPTSGFIAFNTTANSCATTYATSDSVTIDLISNACSGLNNANYMVSKLDALYTIASNQPLNLATTKAVVNTPVENTNTLKIDNNQTISFTKTISGLNVAGAPTTVPETTKITLDGKAQIPTAQFTATLKLDLNQDGTPDLTLLDNANAGQWTYNGTTLQTPYVAVNKDTQTIIRINNASSLNANVYWTCTDDNGVTVQNVVAPSALAKQTFIKAGGADAWLMNDVLSAAQAKNPDFAPDGKMRCNALVTSTTGISGLEIMTINGSRDRVIPITTN